MVKETCWGQRKKQKGENPENCLLFSHQLAVWFGAFSVFVPQFPKYTVGKCGLKLSCACGSPRALVEGQILIQ